jgi:glycerol kinase
MQMQADILQIEVSCPVINETTSLGAAYAAGLAVGFWKNKDELRLHWKESNRWKPDSTSELATHGVVQWKKAIERTLNWL